MTFVRKASDLVSHTLCVKLVTLLALIYQVEWTVSIF